MKFGHFKSSFGKRKGKSNDACRRLPESMCSALIKTYQDKTFTGQNFIHFFLCISFYLDQFVSSVTSSG